tara:strand:+ start:129 stop:518 length:390 start_codon:yes stop_codon:yes gene_type:complete
MNSEELNIRHFKLINGEEIVALVHNKDDKFVAIERPMKILQNMFGGYQLAPWFVFSNQKMFALHQNQVLHSCIVDDNFKDTYIKVSTDVQVPTLRADPGDMVEDLETSEMLDELDDIVRETEKKDRILH